MNKILTKPKKTVIVLNSMLLVVLTTIFFFEKNSDPFSYIYMILFHAGTFNFIVGTLLVLLSIFIKRLYPYGKIMLLMFLIILGLFAIGLLLNSVIDPLHSNLD